MKIPLSYYQSNDVVFLAKDLLGKQLFTHIDGILTGGLITETEAYAGITDKASHAYGGRHTERTKIMYEAGGRAYVYLCYGIHFLFNIVTAEKGTPHAVLIRGIFPNYGINEILKRRNKNRLTPDLTNGPGKLTNALGINLSQNGSMLNGEEIWVEDREMKILESEVEVTKRIGVDYAAEDANLPYRFVINPKLLNKKNAPNLWGVQ